MEKVVFKIVYIHAPCASLTLWNSRYTHYLMVWGFRIRQGPPQEQQALLVADSLLPSQNWVDLRTALKRHGGDRVVSEWGSCRPTSNGVSPPVSVPVPFYTLNRTDLCDPCDTSELTWPSGGRECDFCPTLHCCTMWVLKAVPCWVLGGREWESLASFEHRHGRLKVGLEADPPIRASFRMTLVQILPVSDFRKNLKAK